MNQSRLISKKRAFLKAFVECADLTRAAEACRIDRSNHYDWLKEDPEYAAAFAEAKEQAGQTLEDDAVHWARVGIFEPLIYQGQFCYAEREIRIHTLPDGREVRDEELPADREGIEIVSTRTIHEKYGPPLGVYRRSEGLHARLLKAFMPERYGDRGAIELTGAKGGPIATEIAIRFVDAPPTK